MAQNAKQDQCAQSPGSTSLHFCPLADCTTLRQRALFRQRVERDYKPQLGAKAMGIYGSIWRCAGNQSLRAIIGLERLMADNGIKSKGGLYPHLRKLEATGLIEIRNRTTPYGSQLANEYRLLDPYLPRLLDLSNHAVFLRNRGSKNDPILEIKSPVFDGRDLIFLDLDEIYERENKTSDAQNPPPQLSQAAEAGGTSISPEVIEAKTEEVITEKPIETTPTQPLVNELDVAYEAIPADMRPELEAAAHERLSAAGVPEFLRILPTIRDMMVRLWLGEPVPVLATG